MSAPFKKIPEPESGKPHTGQRFRNIVTEKRISPAEAAKILGCSVQNVFKLYKKEKWNQKYLERACEKLQISMQYFTQNTASVANDGPVEYGKNDYRTLFEQCLIDKVVLQKQMIELYKETLELSKKVK